MLTANRPGATCVCDSRYEGCDHPNPCRKTPDGAGRGPWCAECNHRRMDSISRRMDSISASLRNLRADLRRGSHD